MKKRFLFFIFLLGFLLVPHETFAQTIYPSGTTYYKTTCRSDIGCAQSSFSSQYVAPVSNNIVLSGFNVQNGVTIVNAIKYQEIPIPFNLVSGNSYNMSITYQVGGYIYTNWNSWGLTTSTSCGGGGITNCFITWNHPSSDPNIYVANLSFMATASRNDIVVGLGRANQDNTILFFNNYTGGQGIKINSVTIEESASLIDISPMVTAQNQTNQKIDQTNNKLDEANNKLDALGDDLVDDTAPSDTDIEGFKGDLPVLSFGPISGALQIPIQYLNYWHTQFQSHHCSPINFGSLLGTNLTLPCINPVDDYLNADTTMGGLNSFIGIVCAIFIYYNVALLIVHAWDTWTSFADDFTGLWRPPSGDSYIPRHAKGGGD